MNTYNETIKKLISTDQDHNLWMRLSQVRDAIFKAKEKELSQYGVTVRQACVLFLIQVIKSAKGEVTPTEISRWMLREHHTVSGILTRMENQGLVSKSKGLGKGNQVYVTLTEKGKQAYRQSLKRESTHEIMSCLSKKERQQLDSSLEKLQDKAIENLNAANRVSFP